MNGITLLSAFPVLTFLLPTSIWSSFSVQMLCGYSHYTISAPPDDIIRAEKLLQISVCYQEVRSP